MFSNSFTFYLSGNVKVFCFTASCFQFFFGRRWAACLCRWQRLCLKVFLNTLSVETFSQVLIIELQSLSHDERLFMTLRLSTEKCDKKRWDGRIITDDGALELLTILLTPFMLKQSKDLQRKDSQSMSKESPPGSICSRVKETKILWQRKLIA